MKKMLNEEYQTKLYTVSVRTFVIPFYYSSDTAKVFKNYGSGHVTAKSYISTVLVPQHLLIMFP